MTINAPYDSEGPRRWSRFSIFALPVALLCLVLMAGVVWATEASGFTYAIDPDTAMIALIVIVFTPLLLEMTALIGLVRNPSLKGISLVAPAFLISMACLVYFLYFAIIRTAWSLLPTC